MSTCCISEAINYVYSYTKTENYNNSRSGKPGLQLTVVIQFKINSFYKPYMYIKR